MRKFSKLARSARSHIHIFPLNVSVLSFYCRLWRHAISNKRDYCIDCNFACRFILWPEKWALARAYKLQMFLSLHLGVLPPPPQYQKAGYATDLEMYVRQISQLEFARPDDTRWWPGSSWTIILREGWFLIINQRPAVNSFIIPNRHNYRFLPYYLFLNFLEWSLTSKLKSENEIYGKRCYIIITFSTKHASNLL